MNIADIGLGAIDGAAAAAEAVQAAPEAAARAAAEAAARLAAEAATAAAEAAAQAQAAAAARASENNVSRLDARNFDIGYPDFDKLAGPRPPDEVKPIDQAEASNEMTSIQEGLKGASNPSDLWALEARSSALLERLAATPGADPAVTVKAHKAFTEVRNTKSAVDQIQAVASRLGEDPAHCANQTAQLLAGRPDLSGAIANLAALKGSPLIAQMKTSVEGIAAQATPESLGRQLAADPDMANYPAGFATTIARLSNSGNLALQEGLNAVGAQLLTQPGGVSAHDAKNRPELVQLMAAAAFADPAMRKQFDAQANQWVQRALVNNLYGKDHGNYMAGLKQFESDVSDLANKTGLGSLVVRQVTDVLQQQESVKLIEDAANKNKSFFDRVEDVAGSFSLFASGIASDIGKGINAGLNVLGDAAQVTVQVAGNLEATGLHLQGEVIASALDAAGFHGASAAVERTADKAAEFTQQFADGAGDGFKGMANGVGFMAAHPGATAKAFGAMARHPELIAKAGESLWAEASKGGYAHAAGYVAANLAPMLLTGGASGVVEGAAEVAAATAVRGAAEVSAEAAMRGVAEGVTETAARGLAGGAVEEASSGVLKTVGKAALEQVKGSFTDIREVAADARSVVADAKELPSNLMNDARGALDAAKNGDVRGAINALHDNSLVAAGKDAYGVVKDAKSFVSDAAGLITDPFKLVTGKAEGLVNKNLARVIKPLESNATARLVRNEAVAQISELMTP